MRMGNLLIYSAPAAPAIFGNGVPPGRLLGARRDGSSSRGRRDRLHHVFHDIFTDLIPHFRPDSGREAVMEAGPDASTCNLVGKGRHVGPTAGHTGCRGAGYRDLRDVGCSEHPCDDTRDAAALDAMG